MAIQPIQQFSYTTGKNSTDASLIIDAMDVLHTGKVDGFCLVSSDSDFTRSRDHRPDHLNPYRHIFRLRSGVGRKQTRSGGRAEV